MEQVKSANVQRYVIGIIDPAGGAADRSTARHALLKAFFHSWLKNERGTTEPLIKKQIEKFSSVAFGSIVLRI